MKNILRATLAVFVVIGLAIGLEPVGASADENGGRLEVTVTNITRGQIFAPILVATHSRGVKLFTLGSPVSEELAQLAEGGDTAPLEELLMAMESVGAVINSGGLLMPGETVTISIKTTRRFDHVSLAAMLVPTNDGFIALNGMKGPRGRQSKLFFSPVYDAGSEMNSELCADIPAGGGCGGEGFSAVDGEGYAHIHAGIHGIGDLSADQYDWRNPAAKISIRRVQ